MDFTFWNSENMKYDFFTINHIIIGISICNTFTILLGYIRAETGWGILGLSFFQTSFCAEKAHVKADEIFTTFFRAGAFPAPVQFEAAQEYSCWKSTDVQVCTGIERKVEMKTCIAIFLRFALKFLCPTVEYFIQRKFCSFSHFLYMREFYMVYCENIPTVWGFELNQYIFWWSDMNFLLIKSYIKSKDI